MLDVIHCPFLILEAFADTRVCGENDEGQHGACGRRRERERGKDGGRERGMEWDVDTVSFGPRIHIPSHATRGEGERVREKE